MENVTTLFDVTLAADWYEKQSSLALWGLLVLAIGLLAFGGDRAVSGAARLAELLGISKIIVGATIVSLGTTSAEVFVSVVAAFKGQGGLALGNAVGSIIADTALIFGLCCLIRPLPKDPFVLHRQGVTKLSTDTLLTVCLFGLAWANGGFSGVVFPRWMGVLFVVLLGVYLLMSLRWARQHPQMVEGAVEVAAHAPAAAMGPSKLWPVVIALGLTAFGLGVVIVGSEVLIGSVMVLSTRMGVPQEMLAATVVAFGTSVPELVTAIAALAKGHPELLVGNVIGADILNVLFVAGLSAVAMPLDVPPSFFSLYVPVMWCSTILLGLYIFLTPGNTFRRWQGVPLLALYVGYVALLIFTRGSVG